MRGPNRGATSAAVGVLVLLCTSTGAAAQGAPHLQAVSHMASVVPGSIHGVVLDEKGVPVTGAIVSAFGATYAIATTDRAGRFDLAQLSPGPYLLRAHLSGFVASRGQLVDVRPSSRVSSSISMRRVTAAAASAAPVLAAAAVAVPDAAAPPASEPATGTKDDDHSELAWRLRHARRGVLKDATVPEAILADEAPDPNIFAPAYLIGRAVGSPARLATSFFSATPFSGQVNLLTTGSFDNPQQLFTINSFSRGVAYLAVSAPVGSSADWTVRGALTQGDLSSWIVAGSYATRAPARHRYDIGMSYATQRYDGGNPAALSAVTDGSRNAGALYGFDTFAITKAVSLTYGARYARYDYLADRSLISPRVALTITPADHFRISTLAASRASAPGAEEFLPPGETGIWLPPQRTFSSISRRLPLRAERTTHVELELERDLTALSTLTVRVFRQHVDDQLVTMFGVHGPGRSSEIGHYFVANNGDMDAIGWSAGLRGAVAPHIHGSLEYSQARAGWNPSPDLTYLLLVAPSAARAEAERIHNVSTAIETVVPETSTRVLVLYRVSNAFAHGPAGPLSGGAFRPASASAERPAFDARFDVQVRQSLPFMNFSSARWEMLLGVHNFFRDTGPDQSLYDELLVVRPPKRVVGGLTLHF